ncbi:hypothetical protein [Leptospira saintgironsiae]|uniref:hypothetical protein n=1 Tax=Leptospira saintgironsiae TaxID=2023183 RepID=UPI001FCC169C|nr:hypothetical protein [Leptospira saintgironsiae]
MGAVPKELLSVKSDWPRTIVAASPFSKILQEFPATPPQVELVSFRRNFKSWVFKNVSLEGSQGFSVEIAPQFAKNEKQIIYNKFLILLDKG